MQKSMAVLAGVAERLLSMRLAGGNGRREREQTFVVRMASRAPDAVTKLMTRRKLTLDLSMIALLAAQVLQLVKMAEQPSSSLLALSSGMVAALVLAYEELLPRESELQHQ